MKNILSLVALLFASSSFAQTNLENRLTQKVYDCEDINQNSATLFAYYMHQNQLDSAKSVIDFWEEKCGEREPLVRAKIVYSILTGELDESIYNKSILDMVENFDIRLSNSTANSKTHFEKYKAYYNFIPLNSAFDKETQRIADSITDFDNPLEELFCRLYSGEVDNFYYLLQQDEYKSYMVRKLYDNQIAEASTPIQVHLFLSTGLFIPTKNIASIIGIHPEIGFGLGVKNKHFTYDFSMNFRFLNTKEEYQVLKSDTLVSDYFFGGQIGLLVHYEVFRNQKNEISILTGLSVDGFDTEWGTPQEDIVTILSANINGGIMYKRYLTPTSYVGLSYSYNLVNYNSPKIVEDLSGNYNSIIVTYGFFKNDHRTEQYNKLRYSERFD